jgi:hypothetical protein
MHLALGGRGTLERVFGLAVDSVISAKVCVYLCFYEVSVLIERSDAAV